MRTRQIRVTGRVQGVGYRYALRDEALRLAQVDELREDPPRVDYDRPYSGFEIWPTC